MNENKSKNFFREAFNGNLAKVKELAKDPAVNLNWRGDIGFTALNAACQEGKTEVIKFLLGLEGLNPNLPQNQGGTPFYSACFFGHVDVVSLLLGDDRIDVNKPRDGEITPLLMACAKGHVDVVSLLLGDDRIEVDKPRDGEITPLWVASLNGHLSVVQHLLASGKEIDTRKISTFNNKTAAEHARSRGERTVKDKDESEEDFQRSKANCPQIAALIKAYEKDPDGTISQIRTELSPHERRTNRRKRQGTSDPELKEQKRMKLTEKVQQTDPRTPSAASQDTIWKCAICRDDFKNPKTLPCVHSFCLECLQNQKENGKAPFRCALCTAQFIIPANGLESMKTSPLLAAPSTSSSTSSSSSSSSSSTSFDPNDVKCQLCEGSEEASSYCGECDQFLGPLCLSVHGRIPSSKHHHLQSLDDHFSKSSSKKGAASKRVFRCQTHSNQEMDTYCKTCQVIACSKCIVESHAKHDFCPLSEEAKVLKEELIDMTSLIAVREKEAGDGVKKFVGALGKLEGEEQASENELEKVFDLLHCELDHRKAEILVSLGDRVHRLDKVIRLEKEEVEFAMAEFKGYREMSETLLTTGSDVEIAAGHSMLMTRGKTLDDLGFLSEPSVKASIRFHPKNLDAVKQAIASFGDIQ